MVVPLFDTDPKTRTLWRFALQLPWVCPELDELGWMYGCMDGWVGGWEFSPARNNSRETMHDVESGHSHIKMNQPHLRAQDGEGGQSPFSLTLARRMEKE